MGLQWNLPWLLPTGAAAFTVWPTVWPTVRPTGRPSVRPTEQWAGGSMGSSVSKPSERGRRAKPGGQAGGQSWAVLAAQRRSSRRVGSPGPPLTPPDMRARHPAVRQAVVLSLRRAPYKKGQAITARPLYNVGQEWLVTNSARPTRTTTGISQTTTSPRNSLYIRIDPLVDVQKVNRTQHMRSRLRSETTCSGWSPRRPPGPSGPGDRQARTATR
jgi:hypothetical protein